LTILPSAPSTWLEYAITFRHGQSVYDIVVHEPGAICDGEALLEIDGRVVEGTTINLVDDGARHVVTLTPRRESK
jgi:cellobiose phosphorylase